MSVVARTLSIMGHPLVLLPAAALLALGAAGDRDALPRAVLGFAAIGTVVMGWSWWQVRHARWQHVDASAQGERRSLNMFVFVLLVAGAALAWRFAPGPLALGIGVSAALVLCALSSARWCKLSLHVGFAVLAALMLWRIGTWATLLGLCFAAAVAWSRLALGRHVPRDVYAGAIAGALAGAAFWWLLPASGS